jgi:hypothetical protein
MASNLLTHGVGAGPGPITLLYDTFTGTNNTLLTTHTMDVGPGWTAVVNNWKISTNQAVPNSSGNECLDVADSGQSNVTAAVDSDFTNVGSNTDACLIIRYQDSSNYWLLQLIAASNVLKLYEKGSGSFVLRGSTSYTVSINTTYTLEIVASGNNFTCYVNGVSELTYTGSDFNTATKCGIRSFYSINMNLDNFKVTNP